MITHTGEKLNKCLECNKSFGESVALRKHMVTHTGEKLHKCAECNKSFSDAYNLQRHILNHSGERLYSVHSATNQSVKVEI